jgi:hypothetical protein
MTLDKLIKNCVGAGYFLLVLLPLMQHNQRLRVTPVQQTFLMI